MSSDSRIKLLDLIMCLSDAMDFIDPAVVSHHKQVAYIASCIAEEMGLPISDRKDLLIAGALHDIGAFSLKQRKDILRFEVESTQEHAEAGYAILSAFTPLSHLASIVRFHHEHWEAGEGGSSEEEPVPRPSHVLHLADRVAVLVDKKNEVLRQVPSICRTIRSKSGKLFPPDMVEAFLSLASKEYFWFEIVSPSINSTLSQRYKGSSIALHSDDMREFSRLFSRIIDFKSPFTATHSSGVAASAELLSRYVGYTKKEQRAMQIAGYLHDLGKLAIPVEILDKPSGLGRNEYNVIRHHTFYTYRLLNTLPALTVITKWASFHHERLDGKGYPFHLTAREMSEGSQIMAVADVFTALAEDRPYRAGMTRNNTIAVLENMVRNNAINGDIVSVLKKNYSEIDNTRVSAQDWATEQYKAMNRQLRKPL